MNLFNQNHKALNEIVATKFILLGSCAWIDWRINRNGKRRIALFLQEEVYRLRRVSVKQGTQQKRVLRICRKNQRLCVNGIVNLYSGRCELNLLFFTNTHERKNKKHSYNYNVNFIDHLPLMISCSRMRTSNNKSTTLWSTMISKRRWKSARDKGENEAEFWLMESSRISSSRRIKKSKCKIWHETKRTFSR